MEHKVYICSWRKNDDGFELWLKSDPSICGRGTDYHQAEQNLLETIRESGGAMHAVLEFDPPLPRTDLECKYSKPELYLTCGDDRFETGSPKSRAFETAMEREARFRWIDQFFTTPICRSCAGSSSPRNNRPLPLSYVPVQTDGAFGHVGVEAGTWIEIVSEDFLTLLTSEERGRLELREVSRKERGRKFYELLGPCGPEFVAVADLPASGWRCGECGRATWEYRVPGISSNRFVAAQDLPEPLPEVFTVGAPPEVHLCVTDSRWRTLVGQIGVRGFASRPLGVVCNGDFVREPNLPTREERMAEKSQYGASR